jgi:CubicO group peptidase (beta-lactamase class C family)
VIEAFLRELAEREGFSGVVGIRHGDRDLLMAAHGLASRAWNAPVTLDTRFDIASVTKLFTAVAALQLIERGAFDFDTSVVEFLALAGTAISPDVTPYHLLTHTSGIADDADEEAGERYEDLFRDRPNYVFIDTADVLPNFVRKPPNFAPGQGCRYCNVGFVLLGLMVERATDIPYRRYVIDHVFGPAGMTRSGFFRMDVAEPDVAEGVEAIGDAGGSITGWRRNIYSYPPIGGPDGGAHATAGDLLRFHRALASGTLLGPDLTAAMLSPKEPYRDAVHRSLGTGETGVGHLMGYGLEFEVDARGAVRSYWKEGVNVGASALLRHYPAVDITVAVLAIGEHAAWPVVRAVDAAVGEMVGGRGLEPPTSSV